MLRNGAHAVVIDAGTGAWASHIDELGVRQIDGIVLTHTDRDQCCAMYCDTVPPAVASTRLVVPPGDTVMQPDKLADFWREYQFLGCPSSYAAPVLPGKPDATISGDGELCIGATRLCAVARPGHSRGALSYVVEWHGRQLAFCGDAVSSGGTIP